MHAVFLACAAQAVYIVAYVLFKTAMGRISPVSGRHPLHTAGRLARSPRWLAGLLVLTAGFGLSATALVALPVAATLPAYGLGLVLLLAVGMSGFGERPTSREWLAVLLTVAAMVTAALSVLPGHGAEAPDRVGEAAAALPLWKAALVCVPSLAVPLWMFSVRDRPVGGRHARPLTGIAYGLGAGVLLGATEVFGEGMAMMLAAGRGAEVPLSPHPYLFLLAGVLGVGLLSIGLQRCRLTVIVTVVTVTAKTHLLLSATLLYAEPWPRESGAFWLRAAGVGLAALALLAFPRHERRKAPASRDETPRDRMSRDRMSRDPGEPRELPPILPPGPHSPSLSVPPVPRSRPGGTPPSRINAQPRGWPVTPAPARNRESELDDAQPNDADPGGPEQAGVNPASVNPGGTYPSGAHPRGAYPSGVPMSGAHANGAHPSRVHPGDVRASGVHASGVHASGVHASGVHAGEAELGDVNLGTVKIQWG